MVAPWTPHDLGDLKLYLDALEADSIISSGGKVSQWSDLSGLDRHVTQGSAANQPTLRSGYLDFLPDTKMGGSDLIDLSQGVTMLCIHAFDLLADNANVVQIGTNNALRTASGLGKHRQTRAGSANSNNGVTASLSDVNIRSVMIDNISAGLADYELFFNGATDGSGRDVLNMTTADSINLMYSTNVATHRYYCVIIAGPLVQADVDKLHGWAAWRFGLEAKLPIGHPYKGAAP